MIYFTTLAFTLLLSHIAFVVPACGDVGPSQDMFDVYDDELVLANYSVWSNAGYDNPNGLTKDFVCKSLASAYPEFKNFPGFPYLGAAPDTRTGDNCGQCWKLTNKKTRRTIYITAIDWNKFGFTIGKIAFRDLNGGVEGDRLDDIEAVSFTPCPCQIR